jgi:flagellar biosynthetic protein FliR
MDLTLFLRIAEGGYLTSLLIFARIGGLLFSAPLLSNRLAPTPVKVGLAAFCALLLTPLFPPTVAPSLELLAVCLVKEAFVGLLLGWICGLLFSCVQMAGEWLDLQAGFQAAQLFNPVFQTGAGPLGNLQYAIAGLVFMAVGGPNMLLRAAVESFAVSAPGALSLPVGVASDWVALLTRTIWVTIQLATPVGVSLFLTEIAISIANRALPQMNVLMLSLPLKGLLALLALALGMSVVTQSLGGILGSFGDVLHGILRRMAH